MPAALFWGLNSVAWRDDDQVSTYQLQRLHESTRFIRDERAPIGEIAYRQRFDDAGTDRRMRLPRHGWAQWACRGPLPIWVPDGVSTVDVPSGTQIGNG